MLLLPANHVLLVSVHVRTHDPCMVSVLICREEEFKQFQKLMDEQIKEIASKEAEEAEEDAETREEREAFEQRQVEDIKCRGHEVQWQRRHATVVGRFAAEFAADAAWPVACSADCGCSSLRACARSAVLRLPLQRLLHLARLAKQRRRLARPGLSCLPASARWRIFCERSWAV